MAELTAMLARLEDTQRALEEERNRRRELSAEIDAFEERADLGTASSPSTRSGP